MKNNRKDTKLRGEWSVLWSLSKEVEQGKRETTAQIGDCGCPAHTAKALHQTLKYSDSALSKWGRKQPEPQVAQLQWK